MTQFVHLQLGFIYKDTAYHVAGLRLRGVDYSESSSSSQKRYNGPGESDADNWKETTKRVNTQLDNDLGMLW